MGRELKRVPLWFDWPLRKVWAGFQNPYYTAKTCAECDGTGMGPDTKRLSDQWYGYAAFRPEMTGSIPLDVDTPAVRRFAERQVDRDDGGYYTLNGRLSREAAIRREALRLIEMWNTQWSHHLDADDVAALIAADRLWDFTREPRTDEQREIVRAKVEGGGNSWLPESNGYIPTPDEVNAWHILSVGHDGINQWVCVKAKAARLGYAINCGACNGKGRLWPSRAAKKLYKKWKPIEPPTGEGFQLWETVSEGSPVSPVFPTADACIAWLVGEGYSREAAESFVHGSGWAPSMIAVDGEVYRDIESAKLQRPSAEGSEP